MATEPAAWPQRDAVLIVVDKGVAQVFAPSHVDARVVDLDTVRAGGGPAVLPNDPRWRELARIAGLDRFRPLRVVNFKRED